jgi:hypothetical protein
LKFLLRTFAITALVVLAADVCHGATPAYSSLTSKQLKAAIRQAQHPQAPKVGRINKPPKTNTVRTAPAFDAQKASAVTVALPARNSSIVKATAAVPGAIAAPAPASTTLRAPVSHATPLPPPGAVVHDAVISGAIVKSHPSTLVAVGGATTAANNKGTAVINGTSVVRPKQQH